MIADPFASIEAPKKAKSKGKVYPTIDDVEEVDVLYDAQQRKKSAEAIEIVTKKSLSDMAKQFWYGYCHGKQGDLPSSVEIRSSTGKSTKVSMKSVYPKIPINEVGRITEVIGEQRVNDLMRSKTTIKIDADKIPDDRMATIANILVRVFSASTEELEEMMAVLECFEPKGPGCMDALERTTYVTPVEEFHILRHCRLTEEMNRRMEEISPCQVSVGSVK